MKRKCMNNIYCKSWLNIWKLCWNAAMTINLSNFNFHAFVIWATTFNFLSFLFSRKPSISIVGPCFGLCIYSLMLACNSYFCNMDPIQFLFFLVCSCYFEVHSIVLYIIQTIFFLRVILKINSVVYYFFIKSIKCFLNYTNFFNGNKLF